MSGAGDWSDRHAVFRARVIELLSRQGIGLVSLEPGRRSDNLFWRLTVRLPTGCYSVLDAPMPDDRRRRDDALSEETALDIADRVSRWHHHLTRPTRAEPDKVPGKDE